MGRACIVSLISEGGFELIISYYSSFFYIFLTVNLNKVMSMHISLYNDVHFFFILEENSIDIKASFLWMFYDAVSISGHIATNGRMIS
jgi:hypothetical protein